jgi:hypothetical protein
VTRHDKYRIDLNEHHKLIVGEGKSDSHFFATFCQVNNISGYAIAFTGMHSEDLQPAGFQEFWQYLRNLPKLTGFADLIDIILVCDSGDRPQVTFDRLCRQIERANGELGQGVYPIPGAQNAVQQNGRPRVHVLTIPMAGAGGLETVCFEVARDSQNQVAAGNVGTQIEQWVNAFADSACARWPIEKRDKLRLQAFMSACWKSKPDLHFSQLFEITKNRLVPLDGQAFGDVRTFLNDVSAL